MRPIRFLLFSFILALSSLIGAGAAVAQTALPPSLQGEHFYAEEYFTFRSGEIDVTGTCTTTVGSTFKITYTASGIATGPYPGTYTETGSVTALNTSELPEYQAALGVVTEWKATFTIDSPLGQVTGEKNLSLLLGSHAACQDNSRPFNIDGQNAIAHLTYEATIRTAAGTFTDEGSSFAQVLQYCFVEICNLGEAEFFQESFGPSTGVLPVDTSGKATGGGQIVSGSNPLERVTFGFNVRKNESETRLNGTCNVLDHATNTHVKCLTVTDYQQIGNTATWEGMADVNGERDDYRITVQDNGEPNQGIDTFSIVTDTYEAAGNVARGNVQLHKQELLP